jgi:hypothetical protein
MNRDPSWVLEADSGSPSKATPAAPAVPAVPDTPAVSTHFLMTSSRIPIQAHVQWRESLVDVWIGAKVSGPDELAEVRVAVAEWVDMRGGVLGQLVCNGLPLDDDGTPDH